MSIETLAKFRDLLYTNRKPKERFMSKAVAVVGMCGSGKSVL